MKPSLMILNTAAMRAHDNKKPSEELILAVEEAAHRAGVKTSDEVEQYKKLYPRSVGYFCLMNTKR